MKPIAVDWKIDLPNQKKIREMWEHLSFEVIEGNFEFINLLRSNLGGLIYFKGFRINENEIFDWFCSRGRLEEIDFDNNFLLSENILQTFPYDKGINLPHQKIEKEPIFEWKSEFVIDGELAALLFHGGAYGSEIKKTPKEVKSLAQEFCKELFDEKYSCDFVRYYTSSSAWNTWFIDFIIDYTYLIVCMETRTIWILAYTDTD